MRGGKGEKIRVLLVGHSLAAGIAGIPDGEASARVGGKREWVPVVKALEPARAGRIVGGLPAEMDIAVMVGSPIRFAQEQLDKKKPGQYDVVVIFTGGNDVRTRKPAERIARELENLYETAKETLGAKKVLIFNFPTTTTASREARQKVGRLNELIRASAKIREEDVVDFAGHPLLIAAQGDWPKRHPPEKVYRLMGRVVGELVGEWHAEARRAAVAGMVPRRAEAKEAEKPERKGEPLKIAR